MDTRRLEWGVGLWANGRKHTSHRNWDRLFLTSQWTSRKINTKSSFFRSKQFTMETNQNGRGSEIGNRKDLERLGQSFPTSNVTGCKFFSFPTCPYKVHVFIFTQWIVFLWFNPNMLIRKAPYGSLRQAFAPRFFLIKLINFTRCTNSVGLNISIMWDLC